MLRRVLGIAAVSLLCFAQASVPLRGKLAIEEGKPPAIVAGAQRTAIDADEDTLKVLADGRLNGADIEVMGHPSANGHFAADPTHTHPVFVWKNGKRLYVTYWCDVCYIRTYVPGKCWCCQKYTDLDLREKLEE